VFEDEVWEVKGPFSLAIKDNAPLHWEMKDDGRLFLYLLAVGVFIYIVHIDNLKIFQDDVVDEFMNPKPASGSAAGSIYVRSSGSGSAASPSVAPSDMAGPVTSGSKPAYIQGPMQKILIETFDVPAHLTHRDKVADLRVAYSKYLAIQDMAERVTQMELGGTWTHKKPTLEDIVKVYMSRSGYFNRPKQHFPRVHMVPEMKRWLENAKDGPSDVDVWGDNKPSYKILEEILDLHDPSGSKKKKEKKVTKGKKKQIIESPPHSEEEVVKRKEKGKAKAKTAVGGKKKAGPKKSRQADD
jgi:hypothetical protein